MISQLDQVQRRIRKARALLGEGPQQMGTILMEVLDAMKAPEGVGVSHIQREAAKLLNRMSEVKAREGEVAPDPDGELTSLAARFAHDEGEPLRIDQVRRLEFLLLVGQVTLATPEQLERFAQEILAESLRVEVELAKVLDAGSNPVHGSVERTRLSLISNWRSPLDRDKTVDEGMADLRRRLWDLVIRRQHLLSLQENLGFH